MKQHIVIILPLAALMLAFILVALTRIYYHRGYIKARQSRDTPRTKNPEVECERFRKMILKLFELQIIQIDEHVIVDQNIVKLNIRDIYPLYKEHYPMYFPDDNVPEYKELLEIISEDKGYSGYAIAFFEKAAYRHSVALTRFIDDINASSIRK